MRICFPTRSKDTAFLNQERICIDIPQTLPQHIPPEDPFAHLQVLTNIATLAGMLSERTQLRQELMDVAQKALDAAVSGLGEGVVLVDEAATVG